jgi:hypothetical protein
VLGAVPTGGNIPGSFLERYMQGSTGPREYQEGSLLNGQAQGAGRGAPSARQATRDAWAGRGRGQRLGND